MKVQSDMAAELRPDESVSHNGVCLTVTAVEGDSYWVTAIQETLDRSSLGLLAVGSKVNLERAMTYQGRVDGHIVQGHVDQQGAIASVQEQEGSWLVDVEYDASYGHLTVEKGSITVDGVSLTCFNSRPGSFRVAIIPYTWQHTIFHTYSVGRAVNLEFDIIGKYVQAYLAQADFPGQQRK